MKKTALLLLSCAALLMSACASPTVVKEVQTVRLTPPLEIVRCPSEPAIPTEVETQATAAVYIADLRSWGRQCKAASEETERWITDSQAAASEISKN